MTDEGVLVNTIAIGPFTDERKWCACICGCIQGQQGQAQLIME